MAIRLTCDHLYKEYRASAGRVVRALNDVSLRIEEGEFLAIVGSSGSGKSTLLRILAGIEAATAGEVTDSRLAGDGRIGFVFQGESVFPWRTVAQNLTYSLEARGASSTERSFQATELCSLVGLDPQMFLRKYPRELSGGEVRRVAIGMALSAGASLLLFDEPTSQLDYVSRLKLQSTIQRIWAEKHPTVVYVTHDIEEAILLGGRIAVLGAGQLKEIFSVDLPYPRGPGTIALPAFISLRERILCHLDVGP
jgi:NitT/TauT family transport system ATP-binding protein